MQQLFLRWNQGQDLRQALITIAISIIMADQMLAHFGGIAEDISWPGTFDKFGDLHVSGIQYTLTRLIIAAIGFADRARLWFWLKRTRTGMVIRAGVDDRAMVSAMGINIQLTFAIAFLWVRAGRPGRRDRRLVREPRPGSRLELAAEFAGRRDHRRDGLVRRRGHWLAAAGADHELRRRLPPVQLHLLLDHFHLRAAGDRARRPSARPLRPALMSAPPAEESPDRGIGPVLVVVALFAPLIFNTYWISTLLTRC